MTKDEALDKVKKCLQLSSSSNENEAKDAILMAQKLMIKYGITRNEANRPDKKVKSIAVIYNKARIMWYEKLLGSLLANNFKCVFYSSGDRKNGKSCFFMGLEEDVEIVQEVYYFALNFMKKIYEKKIKNTLERSNNSNNTLSSFKNEYYRGFLDGLDKSFKDQIKEEGWGLVLVKDVLVLNEEKKLNLVVRKSSGIPPKFSDTKVIYNKGYDDGNNFGKSFNDGNSLTTEEED